MDKRYQVFVSSTFMDLKEERQQIIQTLMEMDCLPAGMELFPAADEEQMDFIKKVIDDCDYYLLLIGGRYGATTPEGVSYTEKEYDYALEKGLKVIALLHEDPANIPLGKSEQNPVAQGRLAAFREKVKTGRLVKFWSHAKDLPGLVALSLSKTIKTYPAIGWVRGSNLATAEVLVQLNQLRQENEELRKNAVTQSNIPSWAVLPVETLEKSFTMHLVKQGYNGSFKWQVALSWKEIFALIAPYLLKSPNDETVKTALINSLVASQSHPEGINDYMDDQEFQTIGIQLSALQLIHIESIETKGQEVELRWTLTPSGRELMFRIRVQT